LDEYKIGSRLLFAGKHFHSQHFLKSLHCQLPTANYFFFAQHSALSTFFLSTSLPLSTQHSALSTSLSTQHSALRFRSALSTFFLANCQLPIANYFFFASAQHFLNVFIDSRIIE